MKECFTSLEELVMFKEAVKEEVWKKDIEEEIQAILEKKTWSLSNLHQILSLFGLNGFTK